jgi:aminobenzoyl-glutamate transport protein
MFMMVGISPELTQCAYRIGDSVTNPISPLNPYLVIVLAAMRRYEPSSATGSLLALMIPYSVVFMAVWVAMIVLWMLAGVPLGPDGALTYLPAPP